MQVMLPALATCATYTHPWSCVTGNNAPVSLLTKQRLLCVPMACREVDDDSSDKESLLRRYEMAPPAPLNPQLCSLDVDAQLLKMHNEYAD